MALVFLACPGLEVTFLDPTGDIFVEPHLACVRIDPFALEHVGLGLDQPLLCGSLGVEGNWSGTQQTIRTGVPGLPGTGRQLANAPEPALASLRIARHSGGPPSPCRSPNRRNRALIDVVVKDALRNANMAAEALKLDPPLFHQASREP
jgi:hypothetical protein